MKYVIESADLLDCKTAISDMMFELKFDAKEAAEGNNSERYLSLISQRDKLVELREKLNNLEYAS